MQEEIIEEVAEKVSVFNQLLSDSAFQIVTVVVALVFGYLIISNLVKMFKMGLLASRLDNSLVNFVTTIISFFLYLMLLLYCLGTLGLPLSGLVSAISAITLAIGLAVKDIISSVANGIMIATTGPFKENDYVEIGGVGGTVKEVDLMHTVLFTPDNKKIMLPNSKVFTSDIVNYSSNEFRRMDIEVGIDYAEDPEKARKILLKIAQDHPLVCENPAPSCHYNYDDDSAIKLKVRVWCKNSDYWTVNWDLNETMTRTLIKKGVEIPYPQLTVSYRKDGE